MTPREQIERRQRVMRAMLALMDTWQLSGDADEGFYEDCRRALVRAGGTESDVDVLAAMMVTLIVEVFDRADPDEREFQFSLIAQYVAHADMRVRIGKDDAYVCVEFPSRPQIH